MTEREYESGVQHLRCVCGKECEGNPPAGPSWERMATVAAAHGWVPVIKGDAVGMSVGTHFYACCPAHRDEWTGAL